MGSSSSKPSEPVVPPDGSPLFPLPFPPTRKNDPPKWGFIDRQGRLRIAPQYDGDAGEFRNGLARVACHLAPVTVEVSDGGQVVTETYDTRRYGYIDKMGNLVIPMQFSDAGDFSDEEGLARVKDPKSKLWGFVNRAGRIAIPCSFYEVGDFCRGRAMVRKHERGRIGFIDGSGELVIPFTFSGPHMARFTKEGLCWARTWDPETGEEKDGFIGLDGSWAIPPEYALCQSFVEGLACVRRELNQPWIFIDTTGKEVIATGAEDCHAFSEGLAAIQTVHPSQGESEWRYVDKAGNVPHPGLAHLRYLRCGVFRDGVAWVCDKRRRWGLIDRQGKVVLEPGKVEGVGRFEDGLAMVEDFEGRAGYIDTRGQWVRRPPGM
ncbi:hypothetical protein DFJ74DRAFT_682264 [Hyaloraphidium curvatum]|nr:hypothetical protein DFJ74DRAFT_682264 [Hyaloraphidium curvatum]